MNLSEKIKDFSLKDILLIVSYIAVLILGIIYFEEILSIIGLVSGILKPFLFGFIFAFIINVPMKKIETVLPVKKQGLNKQ